MAALAKPQVRLCNVDYQHSNGYQHEQGALATLCTDIVLAWHMHCCAAELLQWRIKAALNSLCTIACSVTHHIGVQDLGDAGVLLEGLHIVDLQGHGLRVRIGDLEEPRDGLAALHLQGLRLRAYGCVRG
jgi:hypothetical protein